MSTTMRTTTWIGLAAAVLLAGCSSSTGTRSAQAADTAGSAGTQPAIATTADTCPMQVPGTTVAFADVEGGAALVFTTSGDDVAELRDRVGRMMEMHNRRQAGGGMMMGGGGQGAGQRAGATQGYGRGGRRGMRMGGGMGMPAATASVDEVEAGAQLVLRPQTPAQLEAIRARARAWAGRLAAGECWRMASGAQPQATVLPTTSAADDALPHPSSEKQ
jgi:hypothetical protein